MEFGNEGLTPPPNIINIIISNIKILGLCDESHRIELPTDQDGGFYLLREILGYV